MIESHITDTIRAEPCPDCPVCGTTGKDLYPQVSDRLFGTNGQWTMKACGSSSCGTVWVDPRPVESELWKAYTGYYTHAKPSKVRSSLGMWFDTVDKDYIADRLSTSSNRLRRLINGILLLAFPVRRSNLRLRLRILQSSPKGRWLDVGCGAGDWLRYVKQLGWDAEGVEFDSGAVMNARNSGLTVREGNLESQGFKDATFDVISMTHVIEHLSDVARTINECRRILKSGGSMIVLTPNARSLAHKIFRKNWRGLEPPRHLQVFSPESLYNIFEQAGFVGIRVIPQVVLSLPYDSCLLAFGAFGRSRLGRIVARFIAHSINFGEFILLKPAPWAASCLAVIASVPEKRQINGFENQ